MANINALLNKTIEDVPKAIAAAVVDMATGRPLGVETVKGEFEVAGARAIEATFGVLRGVQANNRYFKDIVMMVSGHVLIFTRLRSMRSAVLVIVVRAEVDLSRGLNKARAIAQLEAAECRGPRPSFGERWSHA